MTESSLIFSPQNLEKPDKNDTDRTSKFGRLSLAPGYFGRDFEGVGGNLLPQSPHSSPLHTAPCIDLIPASMGPMPT